MDFLSGKRRILVVAALGLLAAVAIYHLVSAARPDDQVVLAPHRAVYDLKLSNSKSSGSIQAVRGSIDYDFSGNACDGYELQFRQVAELGSGNGKVVLSELHLTTWEDGAANEFRFKSEETTDKDAHAVVEGAAERGADTVTVSLSKPGEKALSVPVGAVFPTEQVRRIIAAARDGKTVLEFPLYDGSGTGETLYNTQTVIGRAIGPGQKPLTDAQSKVPALAQLTRWPVTVSYFKKQSEAGEQTPEYSTASELYANGVSGTLTLIYRDFSISGELTSLEMKKEKACP